MQERDTNSCVVRRIGVVQAIGPAEASLLVNGKTISIAAAKLAAGTNVGAAVSWDGKYWKPEPAERGS
ncbi:hypothetical protein [Paenibacillus methanolicus]|uniref:Uncharacterized protein n=1 Tax=Paenibacillus methanolicus TaxID=582686 RepID=A0A5S5C5T9_9BACL|nr:hypothetical protein [Paenibacillus methanolicus]TYP73958.1 hypothetical protein BCM02_106237 [Paenibacillus methanolicus]